MNRIHNSLGRGAALVLLLAASASAVTLSAVQDADVATGGGWDNSTLGGSDHISTNWAEATSVIGHIQFDVSGLAPGSVQQATLRLFHDFNTVPGVDLDIYRVTSSWDEATVTWPTRPSLAASPSSTLSIDGSDTSTEVWREWDVTSLVQSWVDGAETNYGMALVRDPDAEPWPYLRSKDYSGDNHPELVVTVPEPASMALAVACLLTGLLVRSRPLVA